MAFRLKECYSPRLLMMLASIAVVQVAVGQMASWVMRPAYDGIRQATEVPVILGDSLGTTTMWTADGKRIAATADSLADFREGLAVTMKKGSDEITGFYSADGRFTPLNDCKVAYGSPYFSCGRLLVSKRGRMKLVNTDGTEDSYGSYISIWPYSNGLACCTMYEDMASMKDLYYFYIDADKQIVSLKLNEKKTVDREDVSFLSSLNEEGLGVVIVKHDVYFYDKGLGYLRPLFVTDASGKKKQARVSGDVWEYLTVSGDTTFITARGASKKDIVTIAFDNVMRLAKITYPTTTDVYAPRLHEPVRFNALYSAERAANGLYGLRAAEGMVFPPQFEDSGIRLNNLIAVKSAGKWGLLAIDKDLNYRMSINKGNPVAFRHQKFETTVRIDLPPSIPADGCRFDIAPEHGCQIDKTSITTRNTESGNFVQYNCVLSIPDSLPDHIVDIDYPVTLVCNGIKYLDSKITVGAWHYKYVNVDLSREETKLAQGNLEFIVQISAEKSPGEGDYPLYVEAVNNHPVTTASLEKLSESRYRCRMSRLVEGVNRLLIKVSETGCPPSYFPFEVYYTAPKADVSGSAVGDGQVDIVVKPKDSQLPAAPAADAQTPADSTAVAPVAVAPADTTAVK